MKLTTIRSLLLVLLLTSFTPPSTCSIKLHNNWDIHTTNKEIEKAIKKTERRRNPKPYNTLADIYFSKAYLAYSKTSITDTLTFTKAIENYKKDYAKCKKSLEAKAHSIQYLAHCYYYIGDYQNASNWYQKAAKIKLSTCQCNHMNYAKCQIRLNKIAAADTILHDYAVLYNYKLDSIKHLVYTDIKNGN